MVARTAAAALPLAFSGQGPALTLDALRHARYDTTDGPVVLHGGTFHDSTRTLTVSLREPTAFGDLDRDGDEDAVVVLYTNWGGTGTGTTIEAVLNERGTPVHVATHGLGDREPVESLAVSAGRIRVTALVHAADDPSCCPSRRITFTLVLRGRRLERVR